MSAVPVPAVLLEIGRRLLSDRKGNDHFTADPIYLVQKEHRTYHIEDGEEDGTVWVDVDTEVDEVTASRLERRFHRGWALPERFERIGYKTAWVFVDAYLSYDAAKERVVQERRKHYGTFRTYVESGCRNHEWKALQAYLIALAQEDKP